MIRTTRQVRSSEGLASEGPFDPLLPFLLVGPHMINRARVASERSISYRGFRVGATALGFVPGEGLRLWSESNRKLAPDVPKDCAEKRVLEQARRAGCTQLLGLTVVGTTNVAKIEEVTNIATPTLHPCGTCRDMFADGGLVTPDVPIVSSGLDADLLELHTAAELAALYDPDTAYQSAGVVEDLGFAGWTERAHQYPSLGEVAAQADYMSVARFVITGEMSQVAA